MNRARMVTVLVLLTVLAGTLAGVFLTWGVMAYLPFLQARKGDWTGAQRLASRTMSCTVYEQHA